MLKIIILNKQLESVKGGTLLLGGFDGLHFGHKKLVEKAKSYGLPIGIMTIFGGKGEESLYTEIERRNIFAEAGIDFVFELQFDKIKNLSKEEFLKFLMEEFSPARLICGEDFRFGKNALGTPAFLKESTQVCVEVFALEVINGQKISSGTIRALLKEGNITSVNKMLDEKFFLTGTVIDGRKVGRTIGFPTANILYPKDKCKIATGVYQTQVEVNGKKYNGITNYGSRPTFGDESVLTETYLDGYSGDLYGKNLKICFLRYLRPIRKFETAEQLRMQLTEDIRRVKTND